MTELPVTQYFTYWRSVSLGARDVIEGLVAPEHLGPSPSLARFLAHWDGSYYWEHAPEGHWLVLVREDARPRERWWLHAALFLLTMLTTSIAGAAFAGLPTIWNRPSIEQLLAGLRFSVPLAAILLAHESGHYMAARRYRMNASPPFFIPFPSSVSLLGTLGAFIRLRSPMFDRRTLFDVGAAGPLAGVLLALPLLILGLATSQPMPSWSPIATTLQHQGVQFNGWLILLGDSMLVQLCRAAFGLHGFVQLSPLAMAGWVGLFITSINLLPLAQFDGGHIAFAMFGRAQRWIALGFWLLLIALGQRWWGWWLWAALALAIGRGNLAHPRVIAPERDLDRRRTLIGLVLIAIFVLTFMPAPLGAIDLP